jgi:hypothetical protein
MQQQRLDYSVINQLFECLNNDPRVYGEDSLRRLFTRTKDAVTVAHGVQCVGKFDGALISQPSTLIADEFFSISSLAGIKVMSNCRRIHHAPLCSHVCEVRTYPLCTVMLNPAWPYIIFSLELSSTCY